MQPPLCRNELATQQSLKEHAELRLHKVKYLHRSLLYTCLIVQATATS